MSLAGPSPKDLVTCVLRGIDLPVGMLSLSVLDGRLLNTPGTSN